MQLNLLYYFNVKIIGKDRIVIDERTRGLCSGVPSLWTDTLKLPKHLREQFYLSVSVITLLTLHFLALTLLTN